VFLPTTSSACEPTDCPEPPITLTFNVVATKIVCNSESDLPNWGAGGDNISSYVIDEFLSSHPNCHTQAGWNFQWANASSTDPGGSFVGEASGWNTFGPTDSEGKTTTSVTTGFLDSYIWVREVLKSDYIPFSYPVDNNPNSAEMYCATDVLNYDNYDMVNGPFANGNTYHCVAFNVSTLAPVNTPPTITLIGANPLI
jgi:hypothetical protein